MIQSLAVSENTTLSYGGYNWKMIIPHLLMLTIYIPFIAPNTYFYKELLRNRRSALTNKIKMRYGTNIAPSMKPMVPFLITLSTIYLKSYCSMKRLRIFSKIMWIMKNQKKMNRGRLFGTIMITKSILIR